MTRIVTGSGRVTVLPLLHTWPDRYGVLAYTTSGAFGDTAIVGYVPIVGIPDMPLMDIASRHQPARLYGSAGGTGFAEACWLMCVGWSGRLIRKPGTLELADVAWSLEVDGTTNLFKTMYGHEQLHVGRITLADPELMAQARTVVSRLTG
ncbi:MULTISPECIES: hypothetical protein [Streptomyces]|uniref:hypothetical protein n=1 Tax=Streptomyces TaxID=1883 RepID=UPI0003C61CD3|nr:MULTISPECIES: hypothetical protein [Streptomyces]EST28535.1 hypothetical protein M877_14540 [Streptomyces niveus NCIMB 11891]TFI24536.1 hypothetical protein E4P36_22960 [Streptomyces sp. 4R-3d]